MTAVARIYKWEIVKLLAQKRTYLGLGAAMAVPLIFVIVLVLQSGGPNDVPLGRYIRDTGLATPFVVLFFMSIWGFPLITALVAGDIVSSESQHGTLKTILTRSRRAAPGRGVRTRPFRRASGAGGSPTRGSRRRRRRARGRRSRQPCR